jgi:flagellar basal-body rod protein FlgB
MPSGLTGSETFRLLAQVMDLRQAAHERIAANLAHQDTPGYEARHLEFQAALKAAVGEPGRLKPAATQPGHFGAGGGDAIGQVHGTETTVRDGAGKDGNTVSPEDEMAGLAQNALMFDAAAQLIGSKYRSLKEVIREGH